MVLGDLFRGWFSKRKPSDGDSNKDIGVSGLPRNIENDLLWQRRKAEHERDTETEVYWSQSSPSFELYIDGHNNGYDDGGYEDGARGSFAFSHDLFHQLDEMMKEMFQGFGRFHDGHHEFGSIEDNPSNEIENENGNSSNLRDKMLENPERDNFNFFKSLKIPFYGEDDSEGEIPRTMMDWSWTFPFENHKRLPSTNDYKDHDLDKEIESGKSTLDDVLDRGNAVQTVPEDRSSTSRGSSFGSFSSTVTRKRADGIIESQKTVKDSEGNEQVTIVRKIGDQAHKKITSRDSTGNEEVQEDLINMNEGDLEKFEEAWAKTEVKDESIPRPLLENQPNQGRLLPGSLYDSVKDLFFPRKNDK